MPRVTSIGIILLLMWPAIGRAQNCCAPSVPQQGLLGETATLPQTLDIGLHYQLLRSRTMYEGSEPVDDPSNIRSVWSQTAMTLAYGIVPRVSVSAIFPYLWKKKSLDLPATGQRLEYTAEGIGDIIGMVRVSPLGRSFVNFREISFGLGMKFPTGSIDRHNYNFPLPEDLQPGTGSWDVLVSLSFYQGFEPVDIFLSGTYNITSQHEDYEFGDQFSYLLTADFHPLSRVDASAALSGIVRAMDRNNGEVLESTGRHQLWLVPGLRVTLIPEFLRLQVFFEYPLYQNVNGIQLGSHYNFRVAAAYSLPLVQSSEEE